MAHNGASYREDDDVPRQSNQSVRGSSDYDAVDGKREIISDGEMLLEEYYRSCPRGGVVLLPTWPPWQPLLVPGGGAARRVVDDGPVRHESRRLSERAPPYVVVPNPGIARDADEYPMGNRKCGVALIFNHELFDRNERRLGTHRDVTSLQNTFQKLGFQVRPFNDLTCAAVMEELQRLAAEDHRDRDCIAVAVLTHGKKNGKIAAKDIFYDVDELLRRFTPANCPSLTGKPKMFFIQACKGDDAYSGAMLTDVTYTDDTDDGDQMSYPVASYSDLLISYATFEGQCAFRNADKGSWYVQTLCDQLDRHATEMDLMSVLTRVNRIVTQSFRSVNPRNPRLHGKVQAPSFTSSLTRRLFFATNASSQQQ